MKKTKDMLTSGHHSEYKTKHDEQKIKLGENLTKLVKIIYKNLFQILIHINLN